MVATSNIALSGLLTIDTVTLSADDLVLVTGNTTASENGLWAAAAGPWTRAILTNGLSISGATVPVLSGQLGANTRWTCTSLVGADVVGTNNLTWRRDSTLLPDIGFDANDVFAYLRDEPLAPFTTRESHVGASQPLTYYVNNTASTANLFFQGASAPFGYNAFATHNVAGGLVGASNGAIVPPNYTLSFWVYPRWTSNSDGSYSALMFISRTNTNSPTGLNTTVPGQYDLTFRTPALATPGTGQDFYRNINIESRHIGGVDSLTGGFVNQVQLMTQRWNYVAISRSGSTSADTLIMVNGTFLRTIATATPVGTVAGRWAISHIGTAVGANTVQGNNAFYAGVRLSSRAWSYEELSEQSRRGLAWCV